MPTQRRRLSGLPFFLIGVIALVLAMSGAATAGALITSKQIKDNTITTKDVKDGSLLLKDVKKSDVAKLKGKNGTNGTNGTNGAPGASAFAPPPTGTLITGGGVLTAQVSSGGVTLRDYVPLPFTTAAPLVDAGTTDRTLWFGASPASVQAPEVDATACPGTAAAPTALPGKLCVYLSESTGVADGTGTLYAGSSAGADAAERSGFYVAASSSAATTVVVRYVWVYNAP